MIYSIQSQLPARRLSVIITVALFMTCASTSWALNCSPYHAAPTLRRSHEHYQKVMNVWDRVRAPMENLTGRKTSLTILSPDAENASGAPFPPSAVICEKIPSVIYVPYSLVELIYDKREYSEDFLAFVLGHELGHRINDYQHDGSAPSIAGFNFSTDAKNLRKEQLADKRGAFFATSAGFTTRKLANEKTVSRFLEMQSTNHNSNVIASRQKALMRTLKQFDKYEDLYQTAIAIAFGQQFEVANRLLAWLDEMIQGDGVPLPEIKIVRAIVLMMAAAPHAPWVQNQGALSLDSLRCIPILPAHSAYWDDTKKLKSRGSASNSTQVQMALEMLREAENLLYQAEGLGGNPMVIASTRACVSLYKGNFEEAGGQFDETQKLVRSLVTPRKIRKSLLSTLANNALLASFAAYLNEHPFPSGHQNKAAKKNWYRKATKECRGIKKHRELIQTISTAIDSQDADFGPEVPETENSCESNDDAYFNPKPMPAFMPAYGQCAVGWTLRHALPSVESAKENGSPFGVVTCDKTKTANDEGAEHVAYVTLGSSEHPYYDAVNIIVLTQEVQTPTHQNLDNWRCVCGEVTELGLTDAGSNLYSIGCDREGFEFVLLFANASGSVYQVVRFGQ